MRFFHAALRTALFSGLCFIASPAPAPAAGALCRGLLSDAVVKGGLVVPDGARCTLRHVTVLGNLLAERVSILHIAGDVAILGNVVVDRCIYASLQPLDPRAGITIGGNVEIAHCREASGKLFTAGEVDIAGNFTCRDNAAPCFAVALTVLGNALFLSNSGGMSYVEGNTVGGNLECRGNAGVTDYGQANRVAGARLGDCAGLPDWPRID